MPEGGFNLGGGPMSWSRQMTAYYVVFPDLSDILRRDLRISQAGI